MGGLSHYLERAGFATAGISLIRLHSEKIRPPRALWVPFELGRPLGVPHDAAFQSRVLEKLIDLFDISEGPVLVDYTEDVPGTGSGGMEGLVCPVQFDASNTEDETLEMAVIREVGELLPWYDIAYKRRQRTTVGVTGLGIEEVVRTLAKWLTSSPPVDVVNDQDPPAMLKLAVEDLRAFYFEAAAGQPQGDAIGSRQLADWFWGETSAAKLLLALRERLIPEKDPALQLLGHNSVVPREQWTRFEIDDRWWHK
ncbi:MAG: hypothetical protein CFH10_01345 [Alphaproteobacteria bacterium MarineAlpha4_Bin2]|mgnify:CR=1 FL=1|nr:MAG: hypothetical protein CFH10_01345 [Alphaproteobacteria bacterium MarineAlpha4_Bin2]